MKCKNCGGNLSLEVMYCPYCGALNEEAKKHVEDMAKYAKEFEDTKEDVYESTKRFSGFSVRLITLFVIVFIGIAIFIASANLYSFRRISVQKKAVSNRAQYYAQLDSYIENKEFLEFAAFAEEHYLTSIDEYDSYYMLIRTARSYADCYESVVTLINKNDMDKTYYCSYLSDSLKGLYEASAPEEYSYYDQDVISEEKIAAAEQMKADINGMLKVYLNFTDEELNELVQASDGMRQYMIENAYYGQEEVTEQNEEND